MICLDIANAVSIISRYAESSKSQHIKTINRIQNYVKESIDLNIVYFGKNFQNNSRNNFFFQEYCNSDYDKVINNRRSTTE